MGGAPDSGFTPSESDARSQLELLQAMLKGTPDAVYTKDLEGRYLWINPAGAQMLGVPEAAVVGKTDLELFDTAEEGRNTYVRDRDILAKGETVTYEAADGPVGRSRVWLTTKGCLRNSKGEVFGIFGISRDITERKRAEQQLRLNEERLRLCLEAAQLATFDWDLRAGAITWSQNCEGVLGVAGSVLNRRPDAFFKKVHPEDQEALARTISQAMKAPGDQVLEFRLDVANGSPRWVRGQGRVLWHEGKPVRALGVVMDVSGQKLAEEELRRNAVFQHQLVGIVSHDIRSPVSAIIGWAHLLRGDSTEEEVQDGAQRILRSAARIERLTKKLLDLTEARLGRGIPVLFQRVNIHEVAERIVDEVRAGHPERSITLDTSGDGDGLWDGDRLGQVMSNLLENALKYSPPGTPVRMSVHGDGRWVELRVHNAGKPIDPGLLPEIFEPFRRGEQKPGAPRSLGLGLYIVRELVESHGGVIEAHSTEEAGTTFTVRLPQLEADQLR